MALSLRLHTLLCRSLPPEALETRMMREWYHPRRRLLLEDHMVKIQWGWFSLFCGGKVHDIPARSVVFHVAGHKLVSIDGCQKRNLPCQDSTGYDSGQLPCVCTGDSLFAPFIPSRFKQAD
ncbi:hypothetical protein L3X38_018998 [Prunus dulcis]|uniref:Uncharacterized protein n=1 Tax=Prunus dulcis TaxID=3755 RepID=A0AAD4ZBJ7_PRUDU|nr:hypothetical protein L3X38_018998 [Prunus dulcis]